MQKLIQISFLVMFIIVSFTTIIKLDYDFSYPTEIAIGEVEGSNQEVSSKSAVVELTTLVVESTTDYYEVVLDGYTYKLDESYQDYLYNLCIEYEIEDSYELLLAQMCKESKYQADVISPTDDYGLMQINKSNHDYLKSELGELDFLDPEDSILAGVYMMSGYLSEYNEHESLSKYNTGTAHESSEYSRSVIGEYLPSLVKVNL